MNIEKKLITSNNKGKANQNNPQYIVLHDTANYKASAGADNHYKWLQNHNDLEVSAHVFVDDHKAIQVIEYTTPAWHTGKLYVPKPKVPKCTNYNSIGVEFCVNEDSNLTQTLLNTVAVVSQLMTTFNIPIEHVITHQMSAGKECPMTFIRNPQLYEQFIHNLSNQHTSKENPDFTKALTYLKTYGVINSPEYWQKQGQVVPYLTDLICNMYRVLQKSNRGK